MYPSKPTPRPLFRRVLRKVSIGMVFASLVGASACTQETQNRIGRAVQNWTGTNGVVEVYNGGKVVKRFIGIDKLSTATATSGEGSRPYRFGYGVVDENLDGKVNADERKVYFEVSDYSTPYVFFEAPR